MSAQKGGRGGVEEEVCVCVVKSKKENTRTVHQTKKKRVSGVTKTDEKNEKKTKKKPKQNPKTENKKDEKRILDVDFATRLFFYSFFSCGFVLRLFA